jgi:hypothetical protein
MSGKKSIFLALAIVGLLISACNLQPAQTQLTSTPAPTEIVEPVFTPSPGSLPLTEADVPRVQVDVAKAAFDVGQAIIIGRRN